MFRYPAYNGTDGRPMTIEVLQQPAGAGIPATFIYTTSNAGTSVTNKYVPEFYNLIPGYYEFRLTDSTVSAASCHRSVIRNFTISNSNLINNDSFYISQMCNGALIIDQYDTLISHTTLSSYSTYLRTEIRNASNVLIWSGNGAAGSFNGNTRTTVGADIINTWPNGTYSIKTFLNFDGTSSINDSCTVHHMSWIKQDAFIDLSPSIFVKGCGNDTTAASILGIVKGSPASLFNWVLYSGNTPHQDSIIAGPQTSSAFGGLQANKTYLLTASDSCGFGQNFLINQSGITLDFKTFANTTNTQCVGDDVTFTIEPISGATYKWYKNGNIIPGATNNQLHLTNIQIANDAGNYYAIVSLPAPACDVTTSNFDLVIDCSPFPVQFGNFKALAYSNSVQLDWDIFREYNNKGFHIERSSNGFIWEQIGFVKSIAENGNSFIKTNYTFTDKKPFNGKNLYRLKQIDLDGKSEYSKIVDVNFGSVDNTYIYPNPTNEFFTIAGLTGTEQIQLINNVGSIVLKMSADNKQEVRITIGHLSDGIYHVQIIDNKGKPSVHKLVKVSTH